VVSAVAGPETAEPGTREFRLPDVGEGLTEAEVVAWRVAPGDTVAVNDVIVEVETAKATVELPSPYAGRVVALLVEPGRPVPVGTPLIAIGSGDAASERAVKGPSDREPAEGHPAARPTGVASERIATLVGYGPPPDAAPRRRRRRASERQQGAAPIDGSGGLQQGHLAATPAVPPTADAGTEAPMVRRAVPLAKPPVRKLARDLGVDLHAVAGTGPGGVITRSDVQEHAGSAHPGPGSAPSGSRRDDGTRREPVRGVRRATAKAMVASAFTAPHVTEFLAVDVTATMELRDRLRGRREFAELPLSPLAFVAKAVCLALRRTPVLNARWDDLAEEIVYHDRVRLGIAAATPRGLLVPTVRDADTLTLHQLAAALNELTATARDGRTSPADLAGGTFTITNVGVFGVDSGTPILNPGEAGILAVGAIKQAPWVVDGALAVRTVCQLALSFDHRLVDGEQGSRFLADVGALLTDPGIALTW
jgi:2-oxoisovalerate dehydrogenase E2 component (dihydrolipoyl transacylase)